MGEPAKHFLVILQEKQCEPREIGGGFFPSPTPSLNEVELISKGLLCLQHIKHPHITASNNEADVREKGHFRNQFVEIEIA